jgi:hypothetical protein
VATTDPSSSVQSSAITAVFEAYGLDGDETARGEMLRSVADRILSPLAAVRDEAAAELRAVLTRVENGETPAEVGLTWRSDDRPSRCGASCQRDR